MINPDEFKAHQEWRNARQSAQTALTANLDTPEGRTLFQDCIRAAFKKILMARQHEELASRVVWSPHPSLDWSRII